jgi:Flp pilus assembly protein TadG
MDLIKRQRDRRLSGMAMVEMVFVLPVLLLLLFGIVEFGVLFGQWQTLTNAAREGAREAVVFRVGCVAANVEADVQTRVANYAAAAGITVNPGDITVVGHCGDTTTNTQVTVTHTYTFQVVPGFVATLAPTIDLIGTSTMRNEGTG